MNPLDNLRKALELAIHQNECEMLMTGDECRAARKALEPAPVQAAPVVCVHEWANDRGGPNDDEVMRCVKCGVYQRAAPSAEDYANADKMLAKFVPLKMADPDFVTAAIQTNRQTVELEASRKSDPWSMTSASASAAPHYKDSIK